MSSDERWAIYYCPPADHPLWTLGCRWLGRAETGLPAPALSESHETLVAAPRRYGLHATLRPPMRLDEGVAPDNMIERSQAIAARHRPFAVALAIAELGDFLALRPLGSTPEMDALAADCVRATNDLRTPLDATELARRRAAHRLNERQQTLLERWGYPFVLDAFHFHISLTGRVPKTDRHATIAEQAHRHFARALQVPVPVTDLAVWREPTPGADFELVERLPLGRD